MFRFPFQSLSELTLQVSQSDHIFHGQLSHKTHAINNNTICGRVAKLLIYSRNKMQSNKITISMMLKTSRILNLFSVDILSAYYENMSNMSMYFLFEHKASFILDTNLLSQITSYTYKLKSNYIVFKMY